MSPDPITVELEAIATSLNLKFIFANLKEANLGIDQIKPDEFPIMVYVSEQNDRSNYKVNQAGLTLRTAPIFCLILNMNKDGTIEYSTAEIDGLIEDMRTLARRVVKKAEGTSQTDNFIDHSITKLYRKFDYHLFGVSLQFNWSVIDSPASC